MSYHMQFVYIHILMQLLTGLLMQLLTGLLMQLLTGLVNY